MSIELRQAAQQALKALEAISDEMTVGERYTNAGQYLLDALGPLRAAIRQAESEPVGEPRARVELMKTGGNAGLSTRIIELDIATRERLRPGDLLYTHPAPGVPDWAACQRIAEAPEVDEALRLFAEGETTEDQAVAIVQAVLTAAQAQKGGG